MQQVKEENKVENKQEEQKHDKLIDELSSSDSCDDPDPTFQEIRKMVSKPSKLMRKATLIHDKIYLGGRKELLDVKQLKDLSITHIIHCAEEPPNDNHDKDNTFWTNYFGNNFVYFGFVSLDDRKYDMIGNHWIHCKTFLEKILPNDNTRIFIACRGGTNRSCTILAVALIHFYKMDCKAAVKAIHDKKFPVLTNNNFIKQIIKFDNDQ
eukprot:419336_1